MRKTMMAMGLGVALALGGAGTVAAQVTPSTPAPKTPQAEGRERVGDGRMERRGQREPGAEMRRMEGRQRTPGGMLLRGIELTDAQKEKVRALHAQRAEQMRDARGDQRMGEQRRQRVERRDSAQRTQRADSMRNLTEEQRRQRMEQRQAQMAQRREQMAERRARMDAQMDAYAAQLREILTPEQRVRFDGNLKEMKERRTRMGPAQQAPARRDSTPRSPRS